MALSTSFRYVVDLARHNAELYIPFLIYPPIDTIRMVIEDFPSINFLRNTGISLLFHEGWHMVPLRFFYNVIETKIQVDGVDNLVSLLTHPSLENLVRLLTAYDPSDPTSYAAINPIINILDPLSELGKSVGPYLSKALTDFGGPFIDLFLTANLMVLGQRLESTNPKFRKLGRLLQMFALAYHTDTIYQPLDGILNYNNPFSYSAPMPNDWHRGIMALYETITSSPIVLIDSPLYRDLYTTAVAIYTLLPFTLFMYPYRHRISSYIRQIANSILGYVKTLEFRTPR